ncbi:BnaC03g62720D [Brassica napus]|uniref:(rape) hypothetical protein n=1 Tax=Brassica napus TaxID=3708 RepID=A0A078H684_BRANA|nr:unnamed protein product [Brassica napus]CDY34060.1 BnaC03g62720D [Brassica napus]
MLPNINRTLSTQCTKTIGLWIGKQFSKLGCTTDYTTMGYTSKCATLGNTTKYATLGNTTKCSILGDITKRSTMGSNRLFWNNTNKCSLRIYNSSPKVHQSPSTSIGFTNYFEPGNTSQRPRRRGLFNIWRTTEEPNEENQSGSGDEE